MYVREFQSTHPGKGATYVARYISRAVGVSIHAPWEGCDSLGGIVKVKELTFQFTHPGKGATEAVTTIALVCCCFNSRTLGRVRHLPTICRLLHSISFNSRTLGRVRRRRHLRDPLCWSFNSRTLGRVRHLGIDLMTHIELFQFTHPGKGATTANLEQE